MNNNMQTATGIINAKDTGALSPVGFLSLLTNCVVWTIYGLKKNDMTVLVPNSIGIATGLFCSTAFHNNCKEAPVKLYGVIALLLSFLAQKGDLRTLGLVGCFLAILTCASPLATIKNVLETKTTASMPFETSLVTLFNALSWASYGLWAKDVMIYGPNLISLGFVLIQMALFAIYGLPPKKQQLNIKGITGASRPKRIL